MFSIQKLNGTLALKERKKEKTQLKEIWTFSMNMVSVNTVNVLAKENMSPYHVTFSGHPEHHYKTLLGTAGGGRDEVLVLVTQNLS